MKKTISILLLISVCSFSVYAQQGKQSVEQFKYHFRILDSVAKVTTSDTLSNCIASVQFMEKHTSIEASTDGNYFGKLTCTKNDLKRWHEWYQKKYAKNARKVVTH